VNILYVVKGLSIVEPLGVMQISAAAKTRGHKSFLGVIDNGGIPELIRKEKIALVAFSLLSTEAQVFLETAKQIKSLYPNLPIIAGGPHPTYFPRFADAPCIDAAVLGEGDLIINPIAEAIEQGKDISRIPNVYTKTRKNDLLPLVSDLDELPFADRELVHNLEPFKYVPMKTFMATRGCPYNCAYCFNNAYKTLYKGHGKLVRRRSVENLITEIEKVHRHYPMKFLRFGDDVFVAKYDAWMEEFAEKYKARVGIPFYCLIRPNLVTEKLVAALRNSGCHSVAISLETGNETLRKTVLNRMIDDETILKAYSLLRDYDMKIFSNCMLGLPESTLGDDLKSLDMTFRCSPTYASFTVFTPFPGTGLYRLCMDKGYIEKPFEAGEYPESTFQSSCLKTVSESDKAVHRNILMLGALANWQPRLRNLIVNRLLYRKPNKVFNIIGFLVRNYLQRKIWPIRLNLLYFLRLVLKVYRIDLKNYAKRKQLKDTDKC